MIKNSPGIRLMVVIIVAALLMLAAALSAKAADEDPRYQMIGQGQVQHTYTGKRVKHSRRVKTERVEQTTSFSGSGLVAQAESYIGKTAAQVGVRRSLWCAAFMNKLLGGGTGSDLSTSYARYGSSAPKGCVGCIAVTTRRGGAGHVGVVKGWDGSTPILISGNQNGRVGVGGPPGIVVALRWP